MRVTTDRSLSLSLRLYRSLLRAYPAAFLAEFEGLLCQAFGDLAHRAVRTKGNWGLLVLLMRSIPDIVSSALRERFHSASDWSFRLRWVLACSIAIPTPFALIFLGKFMPRKLDLLFDSPSDFVSFSILLSTSLHGLATGYLQSRTFGWKRQRRFLWVLTTIAGMTAATSLLLAFNPLQMVLGRTGARILCASAVGIFQLLVLARKNVRAVAWIPASAIGLAVAWRIREVMAFVRLPIPGDFGADTAFLIVLGGLLAGSAYGVLTVLPLEWILQPRAVPDAVPAGSTEAS